MKAWNSVHCEWNTCVHPCWVSHQWLSRSRFKLTPVDPDAKWCLMGSCTEIEQERNGGSNERRGCTTVGAEDMKSWTMRKEGIGPSMLIAVVRAVVTRLISTSRDEVVPKGTCAYIVQHKGNDSSGPRRTVLVAPQCMDPCDSEL